jgi:outer membrane protein assembly factor BamB
MRLLLLLACVGARLASAAVPDTAWTADVAGQSPTTVVAAPDGNVVTLSLSNDSAVITKRSYVTGAEIWSNARQGATPFGVNAIAVDPAGNVSAVLSSKAGDAVVVKYRSDGSLAWDRTLITFASVPVLAVDSRGNALIAGTNNSDQAFVAKVDAATGNLLWRTNFVGDVNQIAVDSDGNAFVGGRAGPLNGGQVGVVAKYSAAAGSLLWQRRFEEDQPIGFPQVIAAAPDGAVVVAGGHNVRPYNRAFTTLKLAGDDGHLQWQRD